LYRLLSFFTAGWVISEKSFGEDKKINFMKLRASYGTLEMTKYQIMVMCEFIIWRDLCFDGSLVNGTAGSNCNLI
jgi:hypothetical protein